MIDTNNIVGLFDVEISIDELASLLQECGVDLQYLEVPLEDWDNLCACASDVATTLNHSPLDGFIRRIIRYAVDSFVLRLQLIKLIRTIYFHSDCRMVPATSQITLSYGIVNGITINPIRNIWTSKK